MPEVGVEQAYRAGVVALFVFGALSLPVLLRVTAPYGGRHERPGWGPRVPARLGWMLMELPAPLCFALAFARGPHAGEGVPLLLLGLFQLHYLQRTFVFPLLMRGRGKRNPLAPVAMAFAFNVVNGSVQGLAVASIHRYEPDWIGDPRFVLGVLLFFVGYAINLHSDHVIRTLRRPGESGHRVPHGGLFRFVSSPNYLGEIVEWCGWALATWSLAGVAFAFFTAANLVPRARSNHRWYRENFADHPPARRALLPGVW